MADFLFSTPTIGSFEIDHVATQLLPKDAPDNSVPVKVLGDGNCLFRAASFLAYGKEDHHDQLRAAVMTEVDDNVEHYADLFLGHARQASGDGQCVGLLSQTLSDGPSHTFSSLLMQKSFLRYSYIAGLEAEVRLCSKLGTWCGMLELAGLATVFGRPVRSVYPQVLLDDLSDLI